MTVAAGTVLCLEEMNGHTIRMSRQGGIARSSPKKTLRNELAKLQSMVGAIASPSGGDGTCWQCGAPASAACAYSLKLVANARWGLTGLGYLVKLGKREDEVRVRVPRCAVCRFRGRVGLVMTFGGAIVGAIVVPVVWSRFWPETYAASGLHTGDGGLRGVAPGIGLVVGLVAGMLSMALQGWILGLRPLTKYPDVVRLRQEGWYFPRSSGD